MSAGVKMDRAKARSYLASLERLGTVVPCGSYRRGKDEIGDLDVAVVADETGYLRIVQEYIAETGPRQIRGGTMVTVLWTAEGHQIDLYRTEPDGLGAMMLFLTGSGDFNKKVRIKAKYRGMLLNQYGLWNRIDGTLIARATEAEILNVIKPGWWVEPADR